MIKLLLPTLAAALVAAATAAPLAAQEPAAEPQGPDTVVFTPRRGRVTYTHGKHAKLAECVSCHHESKPEKPLASKYQKCSECHTTPPTDPMTTSRRLAFHNTAEKTGMCIGCHTREAAAGKTVPTACGDCHKDAVVKDDGTP